jgi:copper chaperone
MIEGMGCEHCVKAVTSALEALEGVTNVRVDLEGGKAVIDVAGDSASDADIRAAIDEAGYDVTEIL